MNKKALVETIFFLLMVLAGGYTAAQGIDGLANGSDWIDWFRIIGGVIVILGFGDRAGEAWREV